MTDSALVWFRRDLRDYDHAALYHALRSHARVYCVFVFDSEILDALPSKADRRVCFIHESVLALQASLRARGGDLIVMHGMARALIPDLAQRLDVAAVYCNRDYEPQALARDQAVAHALEAQGRRLLSYKDQVIFECDEILTQNRTPYGVFTPYKNAWLKKLNDFYVRAYPVARYSAQLCPPPSPYPTPSLADLGFTAVPYPPSLAPGMAGAATLWSDFQGRMARYQQLRDFPGHKGVSYLSVHLRFGTLSIRELVALAWQQGGQGAETWLNELIWRDFYQMILWHRPDVVGHAFKPEFDAVAWLRPEEVPHLFEAWCQGRTGYPLVDAAMRQLNQTGYMHNRLRMVVASFLTKDLGIHWLAGEAYFAQHLNDFDLAANNGGWQWAASTGCDAQPWFRIFNPITQSEKFDPDGRFIRRYVPEVAHFADKQIHAPWLCNAAQQSAARCRIGQDYPLPIVDHGQARKATLARFEQLKA